MNTSAYLTNPELHSFLSEIAHPTAHPPRPFTDLRNLLIARLCCDAGLRIGEVLRLSIADLLLASGPGQTISLPAKITKSKKPRSIPTTPYLDALIKSYCRLRSAQYPYNTQLPAFCVGSKSTPLTSRQVQRIFRDAGLKAIFRPVHPHMLRHTFATRLLRSTNIRVLQALLGHSSLASTQIYTHPTPDDLQSAIASLANLDSPSPSL